MATGDEKREAAVGKCHFMLLKIINLMKRRGIYGTFDMSMSQTESDRVAWGYRISHKP